MKLNNQPKVLAATYNPVSKTKMISFLVDFPTVLLAELRTHRILTQGSLYEHSELDNFNLSANSARAIPANKYLDKVVINPFMPIWTGKQSGMSGSSVSQEVREKADKLWRDNLNTSEKSLKSNYDDLIVAGIHKQNANRLLAPFAYTTCIISGTEWENFFDLRCPRYEVDGIAARSAKELYRKFIEAEKHLASSQELNSDEFWQSINKSGAQPEFQKISEMLYDLYQEAEWKESKYHIPFEEEIINLLEYDDFNSYNTQEDIFNTRMLISASMCAKLSYNTQDNGDTIEKHLERANMLIEHRHWEPFSHQAVAMDLSEYESFGKIFPSHLHSKPFNSFREVNCDDGRKLKQHIEYGWCYNNRGFITQRYLLENGWNTI